MQSERAFARFDVIDRPEQLESIRDEWEQLAERKGRGNLYLTYEWFLSLWESHRDSGDFKVFVYRPGGAGTPIGAVFPLVSSTISLHRIPFRQLELATNFYGNDNGFLASGNEGQAIDALLSHLESARQTWDMFLIGSVAEGDELISELRERDGARGFHLIMEPHVASPYLQIQGTWKDFVAGRSANLRSDLRRKENKIHKAARVDVRIYASPGDVEDSLRDIYEIESHSWKEEAGSSITAVGRQQRFYEGFMPRAATRGWLRVTVLRADNVPIAYDLGMLYGRRYLMLKTSYQQAYRELSPGIVLRSQVLQWLFDQGASEHDFLGRDEEWKLKWTDTVRRHWNCYLYNRRRPFAALYYHLRRGYRALRAGTSPRTP